VCVWKRLKAANIGLLKLILSTRLVKLTSFVFVTLMNDIGVFIDMAKKNSEMVKDVLSIIVCPLMSMLSPLCFN
jgi:hypothetical protein